MKNIPPRSIYRSRRVDFSSIDRELAFWVPKGSRPLWAWPWPCGRDLRGLGISSLCSLWPCPQGHAHKARATPTKASTLLEPRRPILDRSMQKFTKIMIDRWGGVYFFMLHFIAFLCGNQCPAGKIFAILFIKKF